MCSSVTVTMRELRSYFINIPETPWLPAAWLMIRSLEQGKRREGKRNKHVTLTHALPRFPPGGLAALDFRLFRDKYQCS